MTFDDVRRIATAFPETHETSSHGTPAFRVGKMQAGRQAPHVEGYARFLFRPPSIGEVEPRATLADAWWETERATIRRRRPEMCRAGGDVG